MFCGCGASHEIGADAKSGAHDENTIEGLLLLLWAERKNAGSIATFCEKLFAIAPREMDQVELYLPQFAHIVANLADDLAAPDVQALERFLLSLSQLSIHIALQLFWMFYALLQENRPKRKGNHAMYQRCARLLLQLEQCVVYGAYTTTNALSEGADTLMNECVQVATEAQSSAALKSNGQIIYSGWLLKKGSGKTSSTRKWNKRFFQVKNRMLYYYLNQEQAAQDIPRGSLSLSDATVATPTHNSYPWYFKVQCNQSGLVLALQAQNGADMALWVRVLSASTALPAPPGVAVKDQMEFIKSLPEYSSESDKARESTRVDLSVKMAVYFGSRKIDDPTEAVKQLSDTAERFVSPRGVAVDLEDRPVSAHVYEMFNAQRDLIRGLTNLADDLRLLPPEDREAAMHKGLAQIQIRPTTYYPLGKSTSEMLRVLRFADHEGVVFSTKARCPLMLFLEVEKTSHSILDALKHATPRANAVLDTVNSTTCGSSELDSSSRKREAWPDKQARLKAKSEFGSNPRWSLSSMIVKSNDDLRQEVFIMQIISFFKRIFPSDVTWLNCYEIQATGPDTGLIETITSAQDIDNLKKTPGYTSLRQLFITRYGPPSGDKFKVAQDNFVKSLAAYSVVMWILMLRDRHNGNLMLDSEGHYFHIDFGFVLGHSTGKQIGGLVECSPFKLTAEYVELMDGVGSPVYAKFCDSCIKAMVASRTHGETICTMIEIVGTRSVFPCFGVFSLKHVVKKLRERLFMHLEVSEVDAAFRKKIALTSGHWGSRWYDKFQNLQRGIAV
ncbi:hypothetical protein AB1Y20_019225 [Prymnesium parvum]|uniref:Phosphatidylinositol 3-kinase n=1 Tax=Prymnesium parvum TaxID=97485 RepID=A0AB34JR45_PRYPA